MCLIYQPETLSKLIDRYLLTEVRDFGDDIVLVLQIKRDLGDLVHPASKKFLFSVKEVKQNKGDLERCDLERYRADDKPFRTISTFVTYHANNTKSGYINQRPSSIKLFLKFFMKFDDEILPRKELAQNPVDFAKDCLEIHQHAGRLIHASCIEKYLGDHLRKLDDKTNLDGEQLKGLKEKHSRDWMKNRKNAKLVQFLRDQIEEDSMDADLHAILAEKFCSVNTGRVEKKVISILQSAGIPDPGVVFASSKSAYRIQQKYEEYCASYLTAGLHAYRRFKDLFRGSITYEQYKDVCVDRLPIVSINSKEDGNYRAFYVILDIDTLNFELKVVKDLGSIEESHQWYELKRNDSRQNLVEFLKRHISGMDDKVPRIGEEEKEEKEEREEEKEGRKKRKRGERGEKEEE